METRCYNSCGDGRYRMAKLVRGIIIIIIIIASVAICTPTGGEVHEVKVVKCDILLDFIPCKPCPLRYDHALLAYSDSRSANTWRHRFLGFVCLLVLCLFLSAFTPRMHLEVPRRCSDSAMEPWRTAAASISGSKKIALLIYSKWLSAV